MRIAIDFQGAQSGSRFRGIGHYSTEFVKAFIRQRANDEIFLVLNGSFTESIEPIRAEFDGLIPQENIRVWYAPGPVERFDGSAGNLREIAEAIREFFLRTLDPDLILLTSIFEGLSDGAVVTVRKFVTDVPVAAIFYDFTPLYMPDEQFQTNPVYRTWYRERVKAVRDCDLLLAISESSRKEVIDQIGFDSERVINVFGGRDDEFVRRNYSPDDRADILRSIGISKPFLLYAGGIEQNKNLRRLVEALSYLPEQLKHNYQFVCVGKREPGETEVIKSFARETASFEMIKTVGFVSKSELVDLYNLCELFIFPSLREGFGLPPLQAMSCGAPTIVSNRTSLPEVVANPDALFDPQSPTAIAAKITEVLTNTTLRRSLVERGLARASELSWDASAIKAYEAIRKQLRRRRSLDVGHPTVLSRTSIFEPNRKRIAVQKLDHHGDFLLGLPAMAKLRARYPHGEIHALVGSWNRDAAEASGLFDHVHSLDYFNSQSSVSAALDNEELRRLTERLPYFDYAIDLRRQSDTRFILVRLNANQYFGYRSGDDRIDRLLTNALDIYPDAGGERSLFDETHTSEQMLRIVDVLPFDANDYLKLPDLGTRLPVRPGSVAIFPRVGNDSRQWDSEYFRALIHKLTANPDVAEVNIFCGRAADLEPIKYKPHAKINVHAGLSFGDLFSTLSSNSVCLGNNSFGVHLASYAGCRTIGIYSGHELPQQWGPPFGDAATITVDALCAPCHLPDRQSCPHALFCLNDISVETVEATVLDALADRPIPEDYSKITANNPASAIKPLIDAVNKRKFLGKIDSLTPDQRVAFAAAVSINFPERASSERLIYLDVSALLARTLKGQSNWTFNQIQVAVKALGTQSLGKIVPIASGPHDHEFYEVNIENLEESLYSGERNRGIVRPLAGDVYVGIHTYLDRNPAQWQLLIAWRQSGVGTILGAPEDIKLDGINPNSELDADDSALASYLFTIGHFDGILAARHDCDSLSRWLEEFGPKRLRKIVCRADLALLICELRAGSGDKIGHSNRGHGLSLEAITQAAE